MFCTIIKIFSFFLCAALVAVYVSQQWAQPNGESLLPWRWNDLELAKNKGLDNDDSNGRCLGWRCFTQTLQMCGMDSVFLLFHLFCVQVTVADTNLIVFSFLPWKNMSAGMIRFQVKASVLCACVST
jgi:hypothetical protein